MPGDSPILSLPAASTITGSESLPIVQGGVTKVETLNVLLASTEKIINKGAANGYPSLNSSGIIPASQLPSYIDDVLEGTYISTVTFNDNATAPTPYTPAKGIIYVDTTTNLTYRWSGSIYVKINDGSVTSFNSRVGAILPVTGDYTKSDVGLGNVDNTTDLAKPISTAQTVVNATKQSFQNLTIVSNATPSIAVTGFNLTNFSITAQAVALTTIAVTGTAVDFDKIIIRITDNGTAKAIALGASFIPREAIIPALTKASIPLTLIFIYNSVTGKYGCIFNSYDSGLWSIGTGQFSIKANNDTPNVASGKYATAMGDYATASGISSMSFGGSSIANSSSAFACGYNTHAYNIYSFSSGYNTFANGEASAVFGVACQSNGNYGSMATGYQARANGNYGAFSHGYQAYADGESSYAGGSQVQALALGGHAGGILATATEIGEFARSAIGNIGQYGIVDWAIKTTDDTQQEVFIGNASANRLRIAIGSVYRVNITACAKDTAGNVKEFSNLVLIKNISGTTSIVGTPVFTSNFFNTALNTAVLIVSADDTNDTLKIEVKGIVATNIIWYIKGEYVKIK